MLRFKYTIYCLCFSLVLMIVFSVTGKAEESNGDDVAEYARPVVLGYYLPVFWENPYQKIQGRPVVDVILGRDGKVIQADLITREYENQKDLIVNSVYSCLFRPAYSEGKEIEGFYRYPVQSCFFLKDREIEKGHIDKLPIPKFLIGRDTMAKLPLLAKTAKKINFGFHVTIDADGNISRFRGIEEESEKLANEHLKELVSKFKFLPAESAGKPVKCNMTMVLYATNGLMGSNTRELVAGNFEQNTRPLPINPNMGTDSDDLEYSVDLLFIQPGIVNDIQILSQMKSKEAIAVTEALRKWKLDAEYLEKVKGALTVTLQYTNNSEQADLISEERGLSIMPPRPIRQTAPVYPRELRAAGIEGFVVMEFVVDKNGKIRNPEPISSTHLGFTQEGIAAVKNGNLSRLRGKVSPSVVVCDRLSPSG